MLSQEKQLVVFENRFSGTIMLKLAFSFISASSAFRALSLNGFGATGNVQTGFKSESSNLWQTIIHRNSLIKTLQVTSSKHALFVRYKITLLYIGPKYNNFIFLKNSRKFFFFMKNSFVNVN